MNDKVRNFMITNAILKFAKIGADNDALNLMIQWYSKMEQAFQDDFGFDYEYAHAVVMDRINMHFSVAEQAFKAHQKD